MGSYLTRARFPFDQPKQRTNFHTRRGLRGVLLWKQLRVLHAGCAEQGTGAPGVLCFYFRFIQSALPAWSVKDQGKKGALPDFPLLLREEQPRSKGFFGEDPGLFGRDLCQAQSPQVRFPKTWHNWRAPHPTLTPFFAGNLVSPQVSFTWTGDYFIRRTCVKCHACCNPRTANALTSTNK